MKFVEYIESRNGFLPDQKEECLY
ncbi:conserved hypothetical protein [Thiomonas arsenitoxydans]|uniref:Uncharacterized protein n=1 Tax=Thiomonas arsenitoxydans (strain DSM 22701 / CIP 110005 / 3As) TaxID=426114 RepID=D6CLN0_THIA3|nr:hypothetical protein THI_2849 [Thiomonas arsenitoxydans]CQR35909.1 conserved hypothetical protein [Thiomonas arsenitoxydans]